MSAQPVEQAPRHPECLHPVANASDDFSGVECCMCERRPCKAVTLPQLAEHAAFTRHLFGGNEAHLFIEQPGTDECAHCGMPDDGTHMQRRGEFDTPKLPDNSDWQPYDVVYSEVTGSLMQAQPTRFSGLVFVPLLPIAEAQPNPPREAVLLVRDKQVVSR